MAAHRFTALFLLTLLGQSASAFYAANSFLPADPFASRLWLTPLQGEMRGIGYDQFSVCFYVNLRSPIPVTRQVPLLLYMGSDSRLAEIVLKLEYERQLSSLYIGVGGGVFFPAIPKSQWTHVCLTWDGRLGQVTTYFDGLPVRMSYGLQQGYRIPGNGYFTFGPQLAQFGQLAHLHFWNRVISHAEVQLVQGCLLQGNLLSWMLQNDASDKPCGTKPEEISDDLETPETTTTTTTTTSSTCPAEHLTNSADESVSNIVHGEMAVEYRLKTPDPLPSLGSISICNWIYLKNPYKYAEGFFIQFNEKNNWMDFRNRLGVIEFSMNYDRVKFTFNLIDAKWYHLCVTWSGISGTVQLFLDGKLNETKTDIAKDYTLPTGGKIFLIDFLLSDVNGNDPTAGYSYKSSDVNVWDRVITDEEVSQVYGCSGSLPGNLVNWADPTLNTTLSSGYRLRQERFCNGSNANRRNKARKNDGRRETNPCGSLLPNSLREKITNPQNSRKRGNPRNIFLGSARVCILKRLHYVSLILLLQNIVGK